MSTLAGIPAEELKLQRWTPIKNFDSGNKGVWTRISNWLYMLGTLAVTVGLWRYFWDKYTFLGWDLFWDRNKRALLRILLPLGGFFCFLFSLGEGKKVQAEIYGKGFWLKIGKKEYAYEYKEIRYIQRSLRSNGPTHESNVTITLTFTNGEQVKLRVEENNVFLNFSKSLLEHHRDYRQDEMLEKYGKGESIDFGSLKASKAGIEIKGEMFAWNEIAELVPTSKHGDGRDLYIKDVGGKTIGTVIRDVVYNDYLLNVILDEEGVRYQ